MSDETNPEEKPLTEAQIKENKHVQHLHNVFGRDSHDRTSSQKYVVELLENVIKLPVYGRGRDGKFDDTAAKLTEGQRILANSLLTDIGKPPVGQTKKPKVTK